MAVTRDNLFTNPAVVTVDDVDVGLTHGPTVLEITVEFYSHEGEQLFDVAKMEKTAEKAQVKLVMAEATLENLAIACGLPASAVVAGVGTKTFSFGGDSTTNEKKVILTGKAPGSSKTRTVTIWKAVASGAVPVSFSKTERQQWEVTFHAVRDDSKTSGQQLLKIVDTV